MDLERLVEVRIGQPRFLCYDFLSHSEGFLMLWFPFPLCGLGGKCSQWCQHMGSSNPHVAVAIYYSNKSSKFFSILRFGNLHDSFHLAMHGFDSVMDNPAP